VNETLGGWGNGPLSLIARNHEDYQALLEQLLDRPPLRVQLRRQVARGATVGPLFDTAAWMEDFSRMVLLMWDTHYALGAPRQLVVLKPTPKQ